MDGGCDDVLAIERCGVVWVLGGGRPQWGRVRSRREARRGGEGMVPSGVYPADVYPAGAFAVAVEGRQGLQEAVDAHRSVRLMAGDYGAGPITVRSGQKLFGVPGTRVGKMVIEPGTTGALVCGVQGSVVFPASDVVTRGNTILRTSGTVVVQGGTLEDNLFVDTRGLDVDVTKSGYLRNNRFIRAPGQLQGNAMLKFRASPDRPSTGNVFLWVNAGGNDGPTTDIVGVRS